MVVSVSGAAPTFGRAGTGRIGYISSTNIVNSQKKTSVSSMYPGRAPSAIGTARRAGHPTSTTASTRRAICGTEADQLYEAQRVKPTEYRFDGLPDGAYQSPSRYRITREAWERGRRMSSTSAFVV